MLTTLPPFCAVVTKFGNLNFLEPCGPVQACNGDCVTFFTMSNPSYNRLTSSFVLLLQYPATHIGPNTFLSTFLSQIHKIFSSFAVKHHVSEPHSTTGLIVVLCILVFVFLDTAFDVVHGHV